MLRRVLHDITECGSMRRRAPSTSEPVGTGRAAPSRREQPLIGGSRRRAGARRSIIDCRVDLAESIIYLCALIADQPRAIDRYIDYFGEMRTSRTASSKSLVAKEKVGNLVLGKQVITGTVAADRLEGLLSKEKIDELRRYGGGVHRFVAARVDDPRIVAELEAAHVTFTDTYRRWSSQQRVNSAY
jgi:hypothetical protein